METGKQKNYTENLTITLTKYESMYGQAEFISRLHKDQTLDKEGMTVYTTRLGDETVAIVYGQHMFKRLCERSHLSFAGAVSIINRLLQNEIVLATILNHPLIYDDDADWVLPFQDDGIVSTVVVDNRSGYCFVFEAGFKYIRLKTMWGIDDHFMIRDDADAVQVMCDDSVCADLLAIKGIRLSRHRYRELKEARNRESHPV